MLLILQMQLISTAKDAGSICPIKYINKEASQHYHLDSGLGSTTCHICPCKCNKAFQVIVMSKISGSMKTEQASGIPQRLQW
jgi:hypothetical protein